MKEYKRKIKLRHVIGRILDLPDIAELNSPQISIISNKSLLAENMTTVNEYSTGRITISGNRLRMTVEGSKLTLSGVFEERVMIEGEISYISFGE